METLIENIHSHILVWIQSDLLNINVAIQLGCILLAFTLAYLLSKRLRPPFVRWVDNAVSNELLRSILITPTGIGCSLVFIFLAQSCIGVFIIMDDFPHWLFAATDLAIAWIVIRILTLVMPNKPLAKGISAAIWCIAFLHIVGVLKYIIVFLQGMTLTLGTRQISIYTCIEAVLITALCLQVAFVVIRLITRQIDSSDSLSPSLKVLIGKISSGIIYTTALVLALTSVGLDLTSLTIFTSALGVGIGFGLKTIISNYVAGVLLLIDHSIKPGDTIELGEVYGTIRGMHGRYASVLTRDGKELLIPNEQLISNEVINWTYSHKHVRLIIPVGISYQADMLKAMELLTEAAESVNRVLKNPAPRTRMKRFAESSMDLELCLWIADAESGINNVKSDVQIAIWKLFRDNGIDFPYPQRDVSIKPDSVIQVELKK